MSEKVDTSHHEFDLESNGGLKRTMTTVTLTQQQFEVLFLQRQLAPGHSSLARQVGNASALGVTSVLLAQAPLSMDLLGFQGADGNSGLAALGAFYACAGIGLYLGAIFEWISGNTFPMVVFGSFGGFWISYAILIQPTFGVAAAFAPANVTDTSFAGVTAAAAGAATRSYNAGLGLYLVTWAVLCFIYSIAATRTNVLFCVIFVSLTLSFGCLSAAHFHTGVGELSRAGTEFKVAGAFGLITSLALIWVDISLILKAVAFPIEVPVFDLSGLRCMQPRRVDITKERVH